MPITVKVGHAKTHLSDLLAKVEQGEEVIIARNETPIARLTAIHHGEDFDTLVAEIKATRSRRPKTNLAEILGWRDEGRR